MRLILAPQKRERLTLSHDDTFFHFGGGMAVRNLGRQRRPDRELSACGGFGAGWDNCYIRVLAAIAARGQ
jgi:hypothetical protein